MKTQISKFCEDYVKVLEPMPPKLLVAIEALDKCGDDGISMVPKARLNDIRARMRSLRDKLENQQGYLLIFGPLKSGKSTLMNAISQDYVSEVTSLPGYPCLVYVGHSDERRFSVTRYSGRESVFTDPKFLHDIIADSHIALAEQIRAAEDKGEMFEPEKHFSEAIRRVDVKFPIENLRDSSTVLVDTPGLYSRMNFGYDLLTREFRDAAACAVFVVKTDNLFLEQVFTEFNELLGLFSRIFLVINTDSSKRDLRGDGELVPSAESEKPQEIIEAFKTLSMAAPLRKAHEEGRVRIHAIDLLNAASGYLKKAAAAKAKAGTETDEPVGEETEESPKNAEETKETEKSVSPAKPEDESHPDRQTESFEEFITDLTEYLNSNDYTRAFKIDSLRQGETLCDEAAEVRNSPDIGKLDERQAELNRRIKQLEAMADALERLISVDWSGSFASVRAHNSKRAVELAGAKSAELSKTMAATLDGWYDNSESLKTLVDNRWNPPLIDAGRELAEGSETRIRSSIGNSLGGAEPGGEAMADLHLVGFTLGESRDVAAQKLGLNFDSDAYAATLNTGDIPVRKFFADWMLFRSQGAVRDRLFGDPSSPEREIAADMKPKRLPEPSRAAFEAKIAEVIAQRFPNQPRDQAEALLSRYVDAFCKNVDERLRTRLTEVLDEKQQVLRPFTVNNSIIAALDDLKRQTQETTGQIHLLAPKVEPVYGTGSIAIPDGSEHGGT